MDNDIAQSLPDLALIVRRDGVILSCVGGNAVRGLNAPEDEIPGRTIDSLLPESIATHVLQTVRRILKTRTPAAECCRIAMASRNRCAWHSTWPRCAKTRSALC